MLSTGPGRAKDVVSRASPPSAAHEAPVYIPNPSVIAGRYEDPRLVASGATDVAQPVYDAPQPTLPNPAGFDLTLTAVAPILGDAASRQPSSSPTVTQTDHARDEKGAANAKKGIPDWRDVQRPVPRMELGPRWCQYCELWKPDRTHHCRQCGTCTLQFDREWPPTVPDLTSQIIVLPSDSASAGEIIRWCQ